MGMLSSYTCGYITDWRTLAKIMSLVSLCASAAMIFVPETPYWLFEKGEIDNGRYVHRTLFNACFVLQLSALVLNDWAMYISENH
jgi:hypothetical protein